MLFRSSRIFLSLVTFECYLIDSFAGYNIYIGSTDAYFGAHELQGWGLRIYIYAIPIIKQKCSNMDGQCYLCSSFVLISVVLSYLQGTMLEKFLTVPQEEFSSYLRHVPEMDTVDTRREAYRYSKVMKPAHHVQMILTPLHLV